MSQVGLWIAAARGPSLQKYRDGASLLLSRQILVGLTHFDLAEAGEWQSSASCCPICDLEGLAAFRTSYVLTYRGRETVANPVADVMHFIADRVADFLTTGRGK